MSTAHDLRIFEQLDLEWRHGTPVVLATVISKSGSVPREVGARMVLWADGSALGTVGGGCVEAEVRKAAREVLLVTKQSGCITVHLTEREAGGTGDICGGTMELFLDYIRPEGSDVGI